MTYKDVYSVKEASFNPLRALIVRFGGGKKLVQNRLKTRIQNADKTFMSADSIIRKKYPEGGYSWTDGESLKNGLIEALKREKELKDILATGKNPVSSWDSRRTIQDWVDMYNSKPGNPWYGPWSIRGLEERVKAVDRLSSGAAAASRLNKTHLNDAKYIENVAKRYSTAVNSKTTKPLVYTAVGTGLTVPIAIAVHNKNQDNKQVIEPEISVVDTPVEEPIEILESPIDSTDVTQDRIIDEPITRYKDWKRLAGIGAASLAGAGLTYGGLGLVPGLKNKKALRLLVGLAAGSGAGLYANSKLKG